MAGNYGKDPLNASHGDSLVGQNFQSLKSKEVRDSVSPTSDLKFHSTTLNHPNTTGWDVQTSSEVSPDGRAYRTDTVATTDGVENINGGTAEFRGRNEQHASASHQGDDKNFVKKASESSNTHLQEHVVIGDENSGHTEMKTSSTTTSSSSNVTSSSSTVEYGGGEQPLDDSRYVMDNTNIQQQQQLQRQKQLQQQEQCKYSEEINRNRQETASSRNVNTQQTTEKSRRVVDMDKASPEYQQHVQDLMSQPGEIISNTVEYPKPNVKMITTVKRLPDGTIVKNKRYETEELKPTLEQQQKRTTSTTTSQQHSTQQRNERQQQTEENVCNLQRKTTKRHEHEDVVDNAEPITRASHPQEQLMPSEPHQHVTDERYIDETSNVETKFSSVKKSSRRFSTETSSETIEEFADQLPSSVRGNKPSQDFSTHGFPSVKPNRPTQEYPGERSHSQTPTQTQPKTPKSDFSTHGFPSVKPSKPTQEYAGDRPRHSDVEFINQHTVTQTNAQNMQGYPTTRPNTNTHNQNITKQITNDGDEMVIVSSESTRSSKYKTNAEHLVETEVIYEGDGPQKQTSSRPVDRGFPATKNEQHPMTSAPRRPRPTEDFTTHGFPSVRDVSKTQPQTTAQPSEQTRRIINPDGSVTVVSSSEIKKTFKHSANKEQIIEEEIVGGIDQDYHRASPSGIRQPDLITYPQTPQPTPKNDFSTHGFPSVRETAPTNDDIYRRQGTPTREQPISGGPSRKPHSTEDFSTHGFPSVRMPTKPDYSTSSGGYPSTKNSPAPKLTPTQPSVPTTPRKSTTTTKETTTIDSSSSQRLISKERDVDASHRAFAASLRCSSPADSIDHHHSRVGTPRSSVSSTRTFRRDGREGSHDSDRSRISTETVTRSSPSKSVGKTVVTKQTTVVKSRNVNNNNGSNETIDLTQKRHTKSPSPNKGITTATKMTTATTTTTRTTPITPTTTPLTRKSTVTSGPSGSRGEVPKTEKSSPLTSAPVNHIVHRTVNPKITSQIRDNFEDVNHDEPIDNQPLSSSAVTRNDQRKCSPSTGPKSSPKTIYEPSSRETYIDRRTVVRENTFESNDCQNTIPNTNIADFINPNKRQNGKVTQDDFIETTLIEDETAPFDASDYPSRRTMPQTKGPQAKEPLTKKPIDKSRHDKKPVGTSPTSPTRRTSDVNTSKVFTTNVRTTKVTRNDSINSTNEDFERKQPTARKPIETVKIKPSTDKLSPSRKQTDTITDVTITKKTIHKEKGEPKDDEPYNKPNERIPTTKRLTGTPDVSPIRRTSNTARVVTTMTRQDEPVQVQPSSKGLFKEKKLTNETQPQIIREYLSPTRRTSETIITKITNTRNDNVSPTRNAITPTERKKELKSTEIFEGTQTLKSNDRKSVEPIKNKPGYTESSTNVNNIKATFETRTRESYEAEQNVGKPYGKKPSSPESENVTARTTPNKQLKPTDGNENEDVEENLKMKMLKPVNKRPQSVKPSEPVAHTSDTENHTTTFRTTAIKTVLGEKPQYGTPQPITDEKRYVEELFENTNKTKTTKNINEEFITYEKQMREEKPVKDRNEYKPRETSPLQPENCRPTTKKPSETLKVETLTERKEQQSSKMVEKQPIMKPRDQFTEPQKFGPVDGEPKLITDSNDDDEVTQETYETATNIKTTSTEIREEMPDDKNTSKPQIQKDKPIETDRKHTSESTNDDRNINTVITTTTITRNIVGNKPICETEEEPREPVKKPISDKTQRVEELFMTANKTKSTKNYNEEFIDIESKRKEEAPDGAFMSKAPEPQTCSPTFKKKGVSPRETFEDRCRQILGMDDYGDTPGSYKNKPDNDNSPIKPEEVPINKTELDVRIEDCEDDEPNYLNNIKEPIKPQKRQAPTKNSISYISDEDLVEVVECESKERVEPLKEDSSVKEKTPYTPTSRRIKNCDNEELIAVTKTNKTVTKTSPKTNTKKEPLESEESEISESEAPDKDTDEDSEPETVVSEREMQYLREKEKEEEKQIHSVIRTNKNQTQKVVKKQTGEIGSPTYSSPSTSPTRKTGEPLKQQSSPPSRVTTVKTPEPDMPTKKTSKSPEPPENKIKPLSSSTTKKKPNKESPTATIKDRLRSATRNNKPSETESDSSPTLSPTRLTERRRSSNIEVHTEIIIDHSGPKSPKNIEKMPGKQHKSQAKKSIPNETSVSPTKPFRRLPVTERKESAPVPSVTRKDKNVKMTRSSSEQVVKVTEKSTKKTEVDSFAPNQSPKSERRPNKCLTTKTINLTTSDKRTNKHEMENVIIDIQHAKSSREPSPDKIVPTPVPEYFDTGKPRYPDVVQEPEDEPRKKPIITNIPIFEEDTNEFVNCYITEINTDKISKFVDLEEDDILDNPTIEAPKSLDYPSINKPDDDCLLSVHEKVSKFTHTAEEFKKPKASSPFNREFDKTPKVPENDECLLSVDEKVNKFIKSAEEVTKPITPTREIERPEYTDLDEELQRDDCTLTVSQKVNKFLSTAEKLAPTTPQRAPELVAKIERTISKQSEPEYPEDVSDDDELLPFSQNHTIELEKRRQKDILTRPTVFETKKTKEEQEIMNVEWIVAPPEYDEFIPHTKDHTTKIELKRQKDILSRPSVYERNTMARPQSPNKREPKTVGQKPQQTTVSKTKTEYTINKTELNGERKTTNKTETTSNKPEARKIPIKLQTSSVALTKSRFEAADNRKVSPQTPVEPKSKKAPITPSTTGRWPHTNGESSPTTSPAVRKLSTEHESNFTKRKPTNEPASQRNVRKPYTEPDSEQPHRKSSIETEININEYEANESETEFISRRRSSSKTKDYLETVQTEIERFSPNQIKEPIRKTLTQENQKNSTLSHSPTRKDKAATAPTTTSTNSRVTKTVEPKIEHKNSPSPNGSDIEIIETVVERRTGVKMPGTTTSPMPVGRTRITTTNTVAARRNLFENGTTPKDRKPSSPSPIGRRPSYMDHTVSSLEHIRRDSLEVNKQNYSRKSSVESESNYERRPNAAVKFDVPQKAQRTASTVEDIDVESIFELEVLERLLETVTTYELRRRIREQIRLVKKNLLNTDIVDKRQNENKTSKSISSTHHKTSTYTSNVHHEETDTTHEDMNIKTKKPYEIKRDASAKRPTQTTPQTTVADRVRENGSKPNKQRNYERTVSPRGDGKSESFEEVITTTTTYAKIPNGRGESPKRLPQTSHERQPSPDARIPQANVKDVRYTSGTTMSTHKEYKHSELTNYEEDRKARRSYSKSPVRGGTERSPLRDSKTLPRDMKTKSSTSPRTRSPDTRKSSHGQRTTSPQGRTPKQRDDLYTSISKVTTVRTTRSPERKSSKPTTEENVPIWADRKNLLKSPNSSPRKVPISPAIRTTAATKTTTSNSTNQRQTQQTRNFEEDSITSSYGIGPTDENGLPLFGIKALKKKKPTQPCEATEVTGYVIEEKYFSDSKTKPKVERKEYIYSTNSDELEEIKKTVEKSRKTSKDDVDIIRRFEKIDKDYVFEKPDDIMPDAEEFSSSSSKYVRRGSVKELSEKFISKESTQSVSEKSGYPKAGLILRTSRGSSAEPHGADGYETTTEKYTTTTRSMEADSEDEQNVQMRQKQSRRHFVSEFDDNESEEHHMSTRSSTKSTRSFLNSSEESKVVTSMDDALERMRNADYVIEAGDTAEDREARSLLNKFLGASVIMKGVESVLPTTKQTKTTRITKTSYADDDDGDDSDLLKNKAVKTTLITKTTKSGSSSTPVTRTTCDIEEIWDEEILRGLLEQATTYEERRKIRARLRDLMAEREEKRNLKSGELTENAPEADESSASEYEEIIEEVTVSDYSDAEGDLGEVDENIADVKKVAENKLIDKEDKEKEKEKEETIKINTENKTKIVQTNEENSQKTSVTLDFVGECEAKTKTSVVDKTDTKSSNNDKGESLVPLLQGILQKSLPKAVAKTLFETEKVPNTEVKSVKEEKEKQEEKENQISRNNTKKSFCNSSSNISKDSSKNSTSSNSNLCPVNNSNKEKNNNNNIKDSLSHNESNTHYNTNNLVIDLNTKTQGDDNKKTSDTTNDSSAPTKISKMTRDIVMEKNNSNNGNSSHSRASSTKQKQLDRLNVPAKEDSGTESGEDLRLIAAGLRDSLHLQSDKNLIEEVTTALARLEQSLKEGNKDIPVDGIKREALLALVARLQTGLTKPDAAINPSPGIGDGAYDEGSSPEVEAQRANRQRFARRRNRNNRHTVGVSREELEDARRYMEDMLLMENISNCTTPESGTLTAPQWFPIEKNPSAGTLLPPTDSSSTLYRPNQFVPEQYTNATHSLSVEPNEQKLKLRREKGEKDGNQRSKRPLSGNFTVSFDTNVQGENASAVTTTTELHSNGYVSPDSAIKSTRFTNKKQLMKRANTIDIPKTKKYNPDFDSDSEGEGGEKTQQLGLRRTLQVNVKHKVRNVIPPFVPKTENDHKFLAFINKQSDKPGLGWAGARSVSNWTNKFGNLKHAFEVGAAAQTTKGKPPQAPGHVPHNAAKSYWQKQVTTQEQPEYLRYQQQQAHQQQQRSQPEAHERQRRIERERLERERIERDRLERQCLERERQERDRLEQEYHEREVMERERLAAVQHAAMPSMSVVPKPAPVNKFQHAPQSVFRPITESESVRHNVFKPIPQLPQKINSTWQPPSISTANNKSVSAPVQMVPKSPQFLTTNKQQSVSGTPSSSHTSSTSPIIGLPWVARPTLYNNDFRKKAHTFEERSQNDNRQTSSYLQRHHSLRSPRNNQQQQHQMDEYKKRPSLPSTTDPYMAAYSQYMPREQPTYASTNDVCKHVLPPPPTNISFTYADLPRTSNYKSYPCLPSAVQTSITTDHERRRKNSLTDPSAIPLVLTNSNPTYEPPVVNCARTYYDSAPHIAKQFDYTSPMDSSPTSPNIFAPRNNDYTDEDLDSDNLMEYRAETRVMGKPKSQTAVTVRDRRTTHASDDEVFGKNSRSAQSLLHTMKNIGRNGNGGNGGNSGNGLNSWKLEPLARKVESPKTCLSPDGRAYKAPIIEPLFPQLNKFEPNRTAEYIDDSMKVQVTTKPQKTRPKTPPIPQQQMDRSLKLAHAEDEKYRNAEKQQKYVDNASYTTTTKTPKLQKQKTLYKSESISSLSSSTTALPYASETQPTYVVTYPTKDPNEKYEPSVYAQQYPSLVPLQRNRKTSETSSASSSVSHSFPSPGTNWTANPIHTVDEILPQQKPTQRTIYSKSETQTATYQTQTSPTTQKQDFINMNDLPKTKHNPKAAQLNTTPANVLFEPSSISYQPPNDKPLPKSQPQLSTKALSLERQPTVKSTLLQTKDAPKQVTRNQKILSSSTKQSQSFDQHYQSAPKVLPKQRTVDVAIPPLQTQNRVLSQSCLVDSKQRLFEQQQREQEEVQLSELRRKSLDNVGDVQKRSVNISQSKTVQVKEEYKSSAPPDTPDIVKSSLPKDDTMPILKKFGPPQRHHYVPNSYQSPKSNTTQKQSFESKTSSTSSKITKSTQHEIVQHSTLTKKPSIVEIPATPQPDENQDLIPRNIVFNNINAFTSLSRRHERENGHNHVAEKPIRTNRLSKSDSWNQIVQIQNKANAQLPPTSPKFGGSTSGSRSGSSELRRTKSGHTLSVRMYEADIDKTQVGEKQRTVEAYFSGGKKSPNQMGGETVEMRTATASTTTTATTNANNGTTRKSAINRHKSSEKVSASRKSLISTTKTSAAVTSNGTTMKSAKTILSGGGLTRSATMPRIASLNLLDESNVEDAFEQLMMGS